MDKVNRARLPAASTSRSVWPAHRLVISAGHCSIEWLCDVLRSDLLSSAGWEIHWDAEAREPHPVRVSARGEIVTGESC